MKVRILRPFAWETGTHQLSRFNVGDIHDVPESLAIYMIAGGQATALEPDATVAAIEVENEALRDALRQAGVAPKKAVASKRPVEQ